MACDWSAAELRMGALCDSQTRPRIMLFRRTLNFQQKQESQAQAQQTLLAK